MSRVFAPWIGLLSLAVVFGCDGPKKPATTGSNPPPATDPPATDPPNTTPPADPPADPPTDPPGTRTPIVSAEHPLRGRLEGAGADACSGDTQCFNGGCSSEVCSAEEGVITTCEALHLPGWPADAACGCVSGSCQWWSASGGTLGEDGGGEPPAGDCGGEACTAPRECVSYYGIAGPSGPKFHTCEIPCKRGSGAAGCPKGTKCVTIADGPGDVCR